MSGERRSLIREFSEPFSASEDKSSPTDQNNKTPLRFRLFNRQKTRVKQKRDKPSRSYPSLFSESSGRLTNDSLDDDPSVSLTSEDCLALDAQKCPDTNDVSDQASVSYSVEEEPL